MDDFIAYLVADCPAVAAVDGQAMLAHMREKLAKNPPASLQYLPEGPSVQFVGGERVLLYVKAHGGGDPRPVVSLSEPPQGRNPEKSRTTSRVPIFPVIRPGGQ